MIIEKKIWIKNIETNYKTFGSGRPFLILHGWKSSSDKWQNIAESLGSKFLVIAPDLPGFGKSQEPSAAWSIDDYVEWLKEFTEKVPELNQQFILLGHSFGGAVSAKFSMQYSQKLSKLFLVAASCIRKKTIRKKILYQISKSFKFLPKNVYEKLRKIFYRFITKSDYLNQEGVMKETYLKVIAEDLSHELSFIKVSTVIIWGGKDTWTPIKQSRLIHKRINNSSLIIIPDADHFLNVKFSKTLSKKILEHA